jgi:hypothetical protein
MDGDDFLLQGHFKKRVECENIFVRRLKDEPEAKCFAQCVADVSRTFHAATCP